MLFVSKSLVFVFIESVMLIANRIQDVLGAFVVWLDQIHQLHAWLFNIGLDVLTAGG